MDAASLKDPKNILCMIPHTLYYIPGLRQSIQSISSLLTYAITCLYSAYLAFIGLQLILWTGIDPV